MPKLHEILAAEKSVSARMNVINEETLRVLSNPHAFVKTVRTVRHFDDADKHLDVTETKDAITTVDDRLNYHFGDAFVSYFNLRARKDRTNQVARADLVIDGVTVMKDVPATFLLSLENQLGKTREILNAIPTLQSGVEWEFDNGERRWKTAEPVVSFKTKRILKPFELAKATDRHPAQVKELTEDLQIAKIEQSMLSGMWTSAQKSDALTRLDKLLVALKEARMRANEVEVVPMAVGKLLSDYLLNGKLEAVVK